MEIGSALRRFAYALKYREANFLLSDAVNSESRILDHRSPTERVERVAPWLRLDGNVYPAVVEGRIQWIVDGFTTSASYPNSRLIELAEATSDSVAQRSNVVTVGAGQVNYVRNAVKATVDAYDGSVKLYGWDTTDPMLKAWRKAFPGSVRPLSEISGDLMAHIRYPQDLLKVQRELITEYHVTNPGDFYSGSDKWRVPRDPFLPAQDQPVVFQSIAMPGEDQASFSITSPFVPGERQRGGPRDPPWPAAPSTPTPAPRRAPAEDYGSLRLLEFGSATPAGPGQVLNQIQNSPVRSQNPAEQLSLAQYITNNSQSGKAADVRQPADLPARGPDVLRPADLRAGGIRPRAPSRRTRSTSRSTGRRSRGGTRSNRRSAGCSAPRRRATASPTRSSRPIQNSRPRRPPPQPSSRRRSTEIQDAYAAGQEALKTGTSPRTARRSSGSTRRSSGPRPSRRSSTST